MQPDTKIKITASEIASLWTSYVEDSLAVCTLRYFEKTTEDKEIKPVIKYALDLSNQHIQVIANLFNEEKLPVPQGFNDKDVDVDAPELFSDVFYLFYTLNMARIGMAAYSLALGHSSRVDIRGYFTKCMEEVVSLFNKSSDTLMSKGLWVRPPRVEVQKEVEFVKKENFLVGLLSEPRPLLAQEIMHMHANTMRNIIGRTLMTGFGQVARSKEVSEYLFRGRDIATKHIEVFNQILLDEHISVPSSSDMFVGDSTTPPFSDKLMMHYASVLNAAGFNFYSSALSISLRVDLQTKITRLVAEVSQYARDGIDIMIKNGWFEQPPQAIDHKALVGV